MKTWTGSTDDGTFAVELQASVLGALDRYCRAYQQHFFRNKSGKTQSVLPCTEQQARDFPRAFRFLIKTQNPPL